MRNTGIVGIWETPALRDYAQTHSGKLALAFSDLYGPGQANPRVTGKRAQDTRNIPADCQIETVLPGNVPDIDSRTGTDSAELFNVWISVVGMIMAQPGVR